MVIKEFESMSEDEVTRVKMFRYDPETDREPCYQEVEVPYEGRTVMDVLMHTRDNIDSTLTFRWACTKGFCRCCAVSVNGMPALACKKLATANMQIDPHPRFEIMKDLVVNFKKSKKPDI
jgi:fumarate reductase iron-sulfur subunit